MTDFESKSSMLTADFDLAPTSSNTAAKCLNPDPSQNEKGRKSLQHMIAAARHTRRFSRAEMVRECVNPLIDPASALAASMLRVFVGLFSAVVPLSLVNA
jgi:hypothetical protein